MLILLLGTVCLTIFIVAFTPEESPHKIYLQIFTRSAIVN